MSVPRFSFLPALRLLPGATVVPQSVSDSPTLVGRGLDSYYRSCANRGRPHFAPESDPFMPGVPVTPGFMDIFYGADFPRGAVNLNLPELGWNGKIGYRDARPSLAGRKDVVTVVFTHGLMCRSDTMWADILKWLFDDVILEEWERYKGVRLIAIDFPGHGDSDKPLDFSYDAEPCSRVIQTALDKIGVVGSYTHVTQSLGYILGMHDINSGRFQINRHISYGTSPEQLGFVLGRPFSEEIGFLGGRTLMESALDLLPWQVMNRRNAIQVLMHVVGKGAPQQFADSIVRQMLEEPEAVAAWFRCLHGGVAQYMGAGQKLYEASLPEGLDPVEMIFFAGLEDRATPITGVREHVRRLRRNPAFNVQFFPVPGNHFGMGWDVGFRRNMFEKIVAGIEADSINY